MKKIFLSVMMLVSSIVLFSQEVATDTMKTEPKWKLDGVSGINFSQTYLSDWAAGGENSLAGNIYLNGSLGYKSGKWAWDNTLSLDYGLSRMQSTGVRKSTDKIDFASKLGYQASKALFYAALFDFKTQFTEGFDYAVATPKLISNFMAPAHSTLSVGLDYKPSDKFSLYFSPLAGRMTFVNDKRLDGMFGVPAGKTSRFEFGSYLKTIYKAQILTNVDLISKADFFTAYNKSFGNIDVDWDLLLSMKVNEYLSATINTTLRYDDDVKSFDKQGNKRGPKVQFKEVFGIGLAYKF